MKNYLIIGLLMVGSYYSFNKTTSSTNGIESSMSAREINSSCDVVVFTTPTCPYCKKARIFLDSEGVNWCELDVQRNKENNELFKKLGGRGVPFAIFGSTSIHGFVKEVYENEADKI